MNAATDPWISKWLWLGLFLIVDMMMIGAVTRLTGSGLSIVEWQIVTGTIPPLTSEDWELAFSKYKQFPQYRKLNSHFGIEDFRRIFWWEYIHRILGRGIGFLFLVPYGILIARRSVPRWLKMRLSAILLFGICQGIMGWLMVKSGLVSIPHVSHFRLALHLGLAFSLIGLILWTILDLKYCKMFTGRWRFTSAMLPVFCLVLLCAQIVFGAFIAGLKAGFSYNSFPLMNGSFFPDSMMSVEHGFLHNGVAMQFVHRWLAWLVLICIIWLWIALRKQAAGSKQLLKHATFLLIVMAAQIGLGILTLMLQVQVILGVLHQCVAVIGFCLLLNLIYWSGLRSS